MSKINPFNNKNKLINKNDVQNILKKYNIFQNINSLAIYQQAFVHKSYEKKNLEENVLKDRDLVLSEKLDGVVDLQPKSYETLEFLGDAIIELVITAYLFERYNDQNEHFLSRLRISLVKGSTLAFLSKVVGLNKYLLVSKTLEEKENARQKDCILEDIFEAFIGAIYMDFSGDKHGLLSSFYSGTGFQVAQKFLINLIEDERSKINLVELILDDGNYKNKLVNYFKKVHKTAIVFKTKDIIEDNTIKKFIVEVFRKDTNSLISTGDGYDLKQAQHNTAKNYLVENDLLET